MGVDFFKCSSAGSSAFLILTEEQKNLISLTVAHRNFSAKASTNAEICVCLQARITYPHSRRPYWAAWGDIKYQ